MLFLPDIKQIKLINNKIYNIYLVRDIIISFEKNDKIKIHIFAKQKNKYIDFYTTLKDINKILSLDVKINSINFLKNKLILIEENKNTYKLKGLAFNYRDDLINI